MSHKKLKNYTEQDWIQFDCMSSNIHKNYISIIKNISRNDMGAAEAETVNSEANIEGWTKYRQQGAWCPGPQIKSTWFH